MLSSGVMKDDPKTGEPFKHTAFMTMAGKLWNELGADEKLKYEKLTETDKVRHAK